MKVIQTPRGAGKTYQALYYANRVQGIFIVEHQGRKKELKKGAKAYGFTQIQGIYTFEEFIRSEKRMGSKGKEIGDNPTVIVDDIDQILSRMLKTNNLVITFTSEDS
jgi:hypothetical protein